MEEKLEEVVEETIQETNQQDPGDENVVQVDESNFESAGDDSILKVDLSKPPKSKEDAVSESKTEEQMLGDVQQSEMIEQRNSGKPPKNFESAGNDILGGGFDLGAFDPS